MKKLLVILSALVLTACSTQNDTTQPTQPISPTGVSAKPSSAYIGVSRENLTQCMGKPSRYLKTTEHEYFSYISSNRCDAVFVTDNSTNKVVDVKYRMPHPLIPYGYEVKERQCPLTQAQHDCLHKAMG